MSNLIRTMYETDFPNDTHLALSRCSAGAVRGMIMSNADNELVGSAEFIPTQAIELSDAVEIAILTGFVGLGIGLLIGKLVQVHRKRIQDLESVENMSE